MIELPRWDAAPGDAERCVARIDEWAKMLRDSGVISLFSLPVAAAIVSLKGGALLDALEDFGSKHWDFRAGRERNQAFRPTFSSAQREAIDDIAANLGLDGTPPPCRQTYDAVIMTGGMVRAGIVKPRYLRELFDGGLGARDGIFLGAFRPFAGDEVTVAPALGVHGPNEFDAMSAGMKKAFDLGEPDTTARFGTGDARSVWPESDNARWREDSWEWNGRNLRVIAAPSSDPLHRRANTVDTYRFWASRVNDIRSVLVITTPIYVPYQGAGAIEVLGIEYGFAVETVAVSTSASDLGAFSQEFLPMHRAQEMRSAIHAFRGLRARVAG